MGLRVNTNTWQDVVKDGGCGAEGAEIKADDVCSTLSSLGNCARRIASCPAVESRPRSNDG